MLKNLKELEIRTYPCERDGASHDNPISITEDFNELAGMEVTSRVKVYPIYQLSNKESLKCLDADKVYRSRRVPNTVWTKRDGWEQK
jgi:hypothetical protein